MDFEGLIADRMGQIDSSGIRKVFDKAQALKNPINLSIGQPDFDVPDPVKDAAIQAIRDGRNKYTVTQGIPELCGAVLRMEKQRTGIRHDAVLITGGVSGGILLAYMALVNPGDKVAIPDPYFVMYKHLCRLLGGVPVYVDTYPDFQLTVERLEQAGAGAAKLLMLNSPSNPTGQVIPADSLKRIADWAKAHGVFIISDEIYSTFCYDEPFCSVAQFTDDVLLLNGFSKSHAMTGWRLGYAIGPEAIIEQMKMLQQYSFVCAPSMVQHAALKAVQMPEAAYLASYRRKRDIIYQGLRGKFRLCKPQGAFYAFVEAPGSDGDAFCQKALERGILIIPGSVFSERQSHFRLSFAAPDETLRQGVRALCELC